MTSINQKVLHYRNFVTYDLHLAESTTCCLRYKNLIDSFNELITQAVILYVDQVPDGTIIQYYVLLGSITLIVLCEEYVLTLSLDVRFYILCDILNILRGKEFS